jgi:hypothetical protein
MTISLSGCFSDWGPPKDVSNFTSADIARGGSLGIFSFHDHVYQPAAGFRAWPFGGGLKELVNSDYIATYDFKTAKVRILYRQDNLDRLNSGFAGGCTRVVQAYGDKVIVAICGVDHQHPNLGYYWLDPDSGQLSPLPIIKELASRQHKIYRLHLVDNQGTLVITTLPASADPVRPSKVHLWVRRPDGEYNYLGTTEPSGYDFDFKDGNMYFWSHDQNEALIYNFATRQSRIKQTIERFASTEGWEEDVGVRFEVLDFSGDYISLARQVDGGWPYERFPLRIRDIVPSP